MVEPKPDVYRCLYNSYRESIQNWFTYQSYQPVSLRPSLHFPKRRFRLAPRGAGQHHPGGDRARATGGLSAPAPPRGGGTGGRPPCATPHRGDGLSAQGPSGPVEHFWGWGMDWIRYLLHDFDDDDFYLSTAILIN